MIMRLLVVWFILLGFSFASAQAEYTSSITDRLRLSGQGGVAFFDTEQLGQFPDSPFLVDEAKLFVEAAIIEDVYVFAEINLMQREEVEDNLQLGEFYIEFEDVGNLGGLFNIRAGRFDIPFGEEYLTRDAIDNPLISHSLSDIWGVDEGVEVFGSVKSVEYVFAIQNGGDPMFNDFNADKAIVGRLLARPTGSIHFSVSAMRTGDLDVLQDHYSEVWFAGGFLVPLAAPGSASTISGTFFQGDGHLSWPGGHVHAAAGRVHYEDDDRLVDNSRDVDYYQAEIVQNLIQLNERALYTAMRFSKINADKGFPLVGFGSYNRYLYDYYNLATELWRLSLGIGCRIHKNVLLKAEYSFENGEQLDGADRDKENFFGIEAAVRF